MQLSYQSQRQELLFGKHIKCSPAEAALVSVFTVFSLQTNPSQWLENQTLRQTSGIFILFLCVYMSDLCLHLS